MHRGIISVLVPALFTSLLLTSPVHGQSVISAHSGVVQYIEGDVSIDGDAIHSKFAQFPEVKTDQVIATQEGRAEILLTPGVFLRLAENSSVRMLSNALSDTRIQIVSGSAFIEVGELLENNSITVLSGGATVALPKKGLYRFDAESSKLRVYDGQAKVTADDKSMIAKKGREVDLASDALVTANFDAKDTDPFYRWSARRDSYVAAANVASARLTSNSGYSSGFLGGRSAWSWNPYFGMFTFMPGSGIYQSPFGSSFYSPSVIGFYYIPHTRFFSGNPSGVSSLGAGRPIGPGFSGRPTPGSFGTGGRMGNGGGMPRTNMGGGISRGVGRR